MTGGGGRISLEEVEDQSHGRQKAGTVAEKSFSNLRRTAGAREGVDGPPASGWRADVPEGSDGGQ